MGAEEFREICAEVVAEVRSDGDEDALRWGQEVVGYDRYVC